jgi:hypothetical protein
MSPLENVFTRCFVFSDGSERQIIKDVDGNMPRPRIRACSICDPFVLILREDDTIGLFIGETERGKIRRKDMSPMGEKVSMSNRPGMLPSMIVSSVTDIAVLGRLLLRRFWRCAGVAIRFRT